MACINTNLPEYKKLESYFGGGLKTQYFIKKWQKQFNTDELPSVKFLENMIDLEKRKFGAIRESFADVVMANLLDNNLIEQKGLSFYVKPIGSDGKTIPSRIRHIENYLAFNNLPIDIIAFKNTKNGVRARFNLENLRRNDIITKSDSSDLINTTAVLSHLQTVFPDVEIKFMSSKDAEQLYMSYSAEEGRIEDFKNIKSFYDPNSKLSIIIQDRVNDETAIEEILHPFVDAVYLDNKELFDNLFTEARKNFSKLFNEIQAKYTNLDGYNDIDRQKELVTQSLSRHFKKEYETQPTKSFLDKIKEFLQWFLDSVVSKLYKAISGKNIQSQTTDQQIDSIDLEVTPKLKNDIENKLMQYLKSINVDTVVIKDLKQRLEEKGLNSDAVAVADVLHKALFLDSEKYNTKDYAEKVATFAIMFMGSTTHSEASPLIKSALKEIETWEKYQEYYDLYKNDPIYANDERKIKIEILSKLVAEKILENKTKTKKTKQPKSLSLLEKIINNILALFDKIWKTDFYRAVDRFLKQKGIQTKGVSKVNIRPFQSIINEIADDILFNNVSKIVNEGPRGRKGDVVISLDELLNNNAEIKNIYTKLNALGFMFTGSPALSREGTIYRKSNQNLHDLDWQVPKELEDNWLELVKETFPEITYKINQKTKQAQVFTKDGKTTHTLMIEGMPVDFFININPPAKANEFGDMRWQDTFDAKLAMGRNKDIRDLIDFKTSYNEYFSNNKYTFYSLGTQETEDSIEAEPMQISVEEIRPQATLSDIAKMLNTSDLKIDVSKKIEGKLQFSLTDKKIKQLNKIKAKGNSIQARIADKLSGLNIVTDIESQNFVASTDTPEIVIQNEDGTFVNPATGELHLSVRDMINGTDPNPTNKTLQFNISKDVNTIIESVFNGDKLKSIKDNLLELSKDQYSETLKDIYKQVGTIIKNAVEANSIVLPNVVIFDNNTMVDGKPLADKIDLLVIDKNGQLKIIKVFTTGTSRSKKIRTLKGRIAIYDNEFDLSPGSIFIDQGKMSQRERHSLRMSAQKKILENMGYELSNEDSALRSIHLLVDYEGKGDDKRFTGEIYLDTIIQHPRSIDSEKLDFILPNIEVSDVYEDEELEDIEVEDTEVEDDPEIYVDEEDIEINKDINVVQEALLNYRGALIKKRDAMENIRSSVFSFRSESEAKEYIQHALSMITQVVNAGSFDDQRKLFAQLIKDAKQETDAFIDYLKDIKNIKNDKKYISYALNAARFAKTYQGLYSVKGAVNLNDNQHKMLNILQTRLNELVGNFTNEKNIVDQAIDDYVQNVIVDTTNQDLSREDAEGIIKYARDIGVGEFLLKDWATSSDVMIRVMDKIFKRAKMEFLDNIDYKKERILKIASKLLKLSSNKNKQELYDFMLDKNGMILNKFNSNFTSFLNRIYLDTLDEEGNPLVFKEITDLYYATQEDIDWNIDLALKKEKVREALAAEITDEEGNYQDGKYFKYTDEFKKYRDLYQEWVVEGDIGYWAFKEGISKRSRLSFSTKFLTEREYLSPIKGPDGNYTGEVILKTKSFVKKEYIEKREDSMFENDKGVLEPMLDERYTKLMNPTTALEMAQKEYYLVYMEIYKEELNNYGPGVLKYMENRAPIIESHLSQKLESRGNFFTAMYAKMARSTESFLSDNTKFKNVRVDENGNIQSQLPIMFVGKPRDEARLEKILNDIDLLKEDYKNGKIKKNDFDKKMSDLKGERDLIRSKPAGSELNRDLTASLVKFIGASERFKTLSETEDTLQAIIKVIESRNYKPSDKKQKLMSYVGGTPVEVTPIKGTDSNTFKKAKEFMKMVFYDEASAKGMIDKISDGLISYTSYAYVSANPFGSFNNYLFGRISNYVEVAGGRFFDRKAYLRAEYEYNKRVLPSIMYRLGSVYKKSVKGSSDFYDPDLPSNKYEALVIFLRMMDSSAELREQTGDVDEKTYFSRFKNFLYVMQDSGEFNVQTKVGMAMVMSTYIKNQDTGEIISLYDAFDFDQKTGGVKLKEGFTTIVKKDRNNKWKEDGAFNDTFRYDLRNKIREVNKLIHGNYARDDRMVIQQYTLGKLFAQFHKWVVPAFNSRWQDEYFDENLGWMEGRLRTALRFAAFSVKQAATLNLNFGKYTELYMKQEAREEMGEGGFDDLSDQELERLQNKIYNLKKTAGEILFAISIFALKEGLSASEEEDEEMKKNFVVGLTKNDTEEYYRKKLFNFVSYQLDRSYKDLALFLPIIDPGGSLQQAYQMFKTPLATTRTLGEIGELVEHLVKYPIGLAYYNIVEGDLEMMRKDKDFYYQRGSRKGELKLTKNFYDIVPILYAYKKYYDFDNLKNFFIK